MTLTLILAIATVSSLILLPTAQADERQVYAYLNARPNPIGVGQSLLVSFFVDLLPPTGANGKWANWTVVITKPDATVETRVMDSDPVASQWFEYTPSQTGTYYFQFTAPQQTYGTTTYKASTTPKFAVTVQTEPIQGWPEPPLPTEYWTRPIAGENRQWASISGNWLGAPMLYGNSWDGSQCFSPYTSAPNSAHIMWTKEKEIGGLVGEQYGSESYYSGLSYESKWSPPVIISGKLFYNQRLGSSATLGVVCVDLATGEQLWFQNGTSITCGQVLAFESMNQHGAIPYLWQTGATYKAFDPLTGLELFSIANASTGRIVYDDHGNMLVYVLSGTQNRLTLWNSTKCILYGTPASGFGGGPDYWRPRTPYVYDWNKGIEWNVTVPDMAGSQSIASMGKDQIIAASQAAAGIIGVVAYSTKTGAQLFNPFNITANGSPSMFFTAPVDNRFAFFKQETMEWTCYSATSGTLLWGPTEPYENAWGMYSSSVGGLGGQSPVIAYGKLFAVAYDGMVHCYDMATGHNDWNYYIGSSGYETPYGTWPLAGGLHAVADDKIYAATGEHSPSMPLYRGAKLVCVDKNNGEEIWNIQAWIMTPAIADGSLVGFNAYDNRIYCFAKGPSSTTVSAPQTSVALGTKVLIQGTVTDIAPGTKQTEQAARFPNGVPAIADEYMGKWMEYVYMQQALPTDATGVPVFLQAVKSDGTMIDIGTATSDLMGHYELAWQPPTEDTYKIIATFQGSDSFWPSSNQCGLSVGAEAADVPSASEVADQVIAQLPTPAPVTPAPTLNEDALVQKFANQIPAVSNMDMAIIAVVVVAILIGVANLALLLKRKSQ